MRLTKLIVLFVIFTLAVSIATPAFAANGTATYKAKCAAYHGPEGQGKVGPAVKGASVTADQINDLLTKGDDAKKAPHKKAISGLSPEDAKAVADYVKTPEVAIAHLPYAKALKQRVGALSFAQSHRF